MTKLFELRNKPCGDLLDVLKISDKLYQKAYGSIDIINIVSIPNTFNISVITQYELLIVFHKIKKEFRSEEMLLFFMLYMIVIPYQYSGICNKI